MKEKTLCKRLKRALFRLDDETDSSLWRKDNRYLLLTEAKAVLKARRTLKKLPQRGERLISLCFSAVDSLTERVTAEGLKKALHGKTDDLLFSEEEAFFTVLTACLLLRALEEPSDSPRLAVWVGSLRQTLPKRESVASLFRLDRLLLADETFRRSDEETRLEVMRRIAKHKNEREEAEKRLKNGTLFAEKKHKTVCFLYAAASVLLPLAVCLLLPFPLSLFSFLPLFAAFRPLLDTAVYAAIKPRRLPRLSEKEPLTADTAVAISCLCDTPFDVREAFLRLRRFSYADSTAAVYGLIADFSDAEAPSMPSDAAVFAAAKEEMARCEKEAPGRFFFFLRERTYAKTENRFTGDERKRGALMDFMRFCRGKETEAFFSGSKEAVRRCRFLLTLDSDTELPLGGASALSRVALHPANAPVIQNRRVVSGHAVFAPRMVTGLRQARQTPFAFFCNGSGGATAYAGVASDIRQDLTGSGGYAGKGLLDIDVCLRLLEDAFPRGRILSHDIPEGLLLRCAAVTDETWTEGCPATPAGYRKRLHRWVRGDTQNLCLLFSSRFTLSQKAVLLDAVREALTPVSVLWLLLYGFFTPWATGIALVSLFSGELLSLLFSGVRLLTAKSRLIGTSPQAEVCRRAFLRLWMLPQTAFTAASAVAVSAFRLTVTKKHLLEWVSAARADRSKNEWGCFLFAAAIACLRVPHLLLFALLWLFSPLLPLLGRKRVKKEPPFEEADTLTNYAAASWRFFDETVSEKTGFLPPDNVQEMPFPDTAMRTSPTNIGLYLLSLSAARDLDFINTASFYTRAEQTLAAAERLEKVRGNLYNWYSLPENKPLSPFVSSVDSGNFLCSLIALRAAVKEYAAEEPRLWDVLRRVDTLINETDLSVFVQDERLLTGICDGEASRSAYDLLMSEALLTVYIGIARGDLPLAVYRSLGRLCGECRGFSGALSWTGTMFEYFMPTLFLPVEEGSIFDRSLRFALACQKEHNEGKVWGISESAFYGFDASLHYGYRAHGVQRAALCRGQNADCVKAPYASFLTLTLDKNGAMKNLKRLKEKGMWGAYGFYEALDQTVSRTNGGSAVVRSYMAHHIGMSLIAMTNALKNDVFVRRFMSYPCAAAARGLLSERMAPEQPVYCGYDERKREKPVRLPEMKRETEAPSVVSPRAFVLTGKELTLALSDSGVGSLFRGDLAVTASCTDALNFPTGIFAFIKENGKVTSLCNAPCYDDPVCACRQVRATPDFLTFFAHTASLDAALTFFLDGEDNTGSVTLTLKNLTGSPKRAEGLLYAEPMLAAKNEELSHRAFSKLFLSLRRLPDGAVFSRREGRGEAFSLAICCETARKRCFDKETLLRRPDGVRSLPLAFASEAFASPTEDLAVPRPFDLCAAGRFSFSVMPHGQQSVRLAFAVGKTPEEALEKARRRLRLPDKNKSHAADRMRLSRLDGLSAALCDVLLPRLCFPVRHEPQVTEATDERLWRYGLSGEEPILLVRLFEHDGERVRAFLSAHRYLSLCGIKSDLVFLLDNRFIYGNPATAAVERELLSRGLMWEKNRRGGVFCIDTSLFPEADALLSTRAVSISRHSLCEVTPPVPFVRREIRPVNGEITHRRPWCQLLANNAFGTLVSDRSLGHTYAFSAKENRLTPWTNDPSFDLSGEQLILEIHGARYSLTDGAKTEFFGDRAVFSGEVKGIRFRVTVTLAGKLPIKRVEISLSGEGEVGLSYFALPAPCRDRPPLWQTEEADGLLLARRINGRLFDGFTFLGSFSPCTFGTDAAAFLSDTPIQSPYPCLSASISAALPLKTVFFLGFSGTRDGVFSLVKRLKDGTYLPQNDRFPVYGDRLLDEFLPWQILSFRLRGRTGFYQSSGAFGFRDQLQDACAAVAFAPFTARTQIIRAACRQFERGDVFHWWLDRGRRNPFGSRTTCSDDLLWLPYAVARYIEVTKDNSVLSVQTPFLIGESPETEGCFVASYGEKASVYEHCRRAISHADRRGRHGLVKIGLCDWNDGLNIGTRGLGETVWGTQFLSLVCRRFAPLCPDGEELLKKADELDGAWLACFAGDRFLRAFTDENEPLGQKGDREMALDILPQAFAALLYPFDSRSQTALDTVLRELWDGENGILKLFSPPATPRLGYVGAYPPGVRENGGQYTHAAIWFLFALARAGRKDEARRLAARLRPDNAYRENPVRYGGEPFLLAADVGAFDFIGRAGWTGYTGAAGWMYRLLTEELNEKGG